MKTVNQPYCQAFTRFFKKLFNHFSKIPNEEIPKRHENTLGFDNKGEPYETIKHSVDFHALVDTLIESLKGWPEYKELRKNLILVDAAGNKFKDKDDFHLNNNFIPSIAYELFYENELSFKCKAKQVRAKYQLIENGIYQDTWLYAAKSPLYNLELESKKIKLDEDFSINKISKVDLEMLFRTSFSSLGNIPPAYSHGD